MERDRIKYIAIGFLTLGFLSTLVFGGNSLLNARKLANQLEDQVDSLTHISDEYVELYERYQNLNEDLIKARTDMVRIRKSLNDVTKENLQSVSVIRSRLNGILMQYDSIHLPEIDTVGISDLYF